MTDLVKSKFPDIRLLNPTKGAPEHVSVGEMTVILVAAMQLARIRDRDANIAIARRLGRWAADARA